MIAEIHGQSLRHSTLMTAHFCGEMKIQIPRFNGDVNANVEKLYYRKGESKINSLGVIVVILSG